MSEIDDRANVAPGHGYGSDGSSQGDSSPLDGASIHLRTPCPCGGTNGTITTKNGQDTVRCADCRRWCYNAPRSETGRPRRSLSSRRNISPSQKTRIFIRDRFECVMCGRRKDLAIGHVVSLRDGYAEDLSDALLYCDANLVVLCAECNAGLGGDSIPPYRLLLISSLRAHHKRNKRS